MIRPERAFVTPRALEFAEIPAIIDEYRRGAENALLGMPYAILASALHFDYSGYTPLCVYGWTHENKSEARERNRQGVSKFTQMLKTRCF